MTAVPFAEICKLAVECRSGKLQVQIATTPLFVYGIYPGIEAAI